MSAPDPQQQGETQRTPRTSKFLPVIIATIVIGGVLALGVHFFVFPMFATPPEIVATIPPEGATDVNPQEAIRIDFSQWMQAGTIANAITIDPPAQLEVEGHRSYVLVRPVEGLEYGTRYQLRVGTTAANLAGNLLQQPFELTFTTAPHVAVEEVTPARGTTEVPLNTPIIVTFDAAIVTAENVAAAAQNPDHASTMPQPLTLHLEGAAGAEVAGVGRWLSPTRFGFYPEAGFAPAATYRATLHANLSGDGWAMLREPVDWSFSTVAELHMKMQPDPGATEVSTRSPIEVNLSPQVDVVSAGELFSLHETESGTAVAGEVEASENGFVFRPAQPLQRDKTYEARLAPGVRSAAGTPITTQPRSWEFTTMGDLEVEQVEPRPETSNVLVEARHITVRFNHPVVPLTPVEAQERLPHPLTIIPDLAGEGRWLDSSTYLYSPTVDLLPATTYRVQVTQGLKDQTGGTLQQEYSWQFTTSPPRVVESNLSDEQQQYASPVGAIEVKFSLPMDEASLQGAVQLVRDETGAQAPINLSTTSGGEVLSVQPAEPLERGGAYTLSVGQRARAALGNATLEEDYRLPLRVAPLPALSYSEPAGGEADMDPTGSVRLVFTAPMDWRSVDEHTTLEPAASNLYTHTYEREFYFYGGLKPDTDYRITVGAAAQDAFGVPLGEDITINFRTGSLMPSLSLVGTAEMGTYRSDQPVRLPLSYINVNEARYTIYRVAPEEAVELATSYEAREAFFPDPSQEVAGGTLSLTGERNQQQLAWIEPGQLEAGVYSLEVRGALETGQYLDMLTDRQIMVVSPYALTIKRSADEVFVWAVELATANPVADLPLIVTSFSYDETGAPSLESHEIGRSDAEGIVRAPLNADSYSTLYVWSPADEGRFVLATTNWDSGMGPWSFGLQAQYGRSTRVGTLHTDRPIYRPDHTVHIRGVVRATQGEHYALPPTDEQVRLQVMSPRGEKIFSALFSLSEFGTFDTSLTLDRSASPGIYRMTITEATEGEENSNIFAYGTFNVAEYRKPAFEVVVTPEREDYLPGETMVVDVAANYYAGGAVASAPVRWRLLADPFTFSSDYAPSFSFDNLEDPYTWYRGDYAQSGGGLVSEGTATTDASGNLTLRLPANLGKDDTSRVLTLDVEVTDVDGQIIANRGSATVHAGSFYIGLRPEGYVAQTGQPQSVSLITLDPDDQPVPDRALEVSIYRREWTSVRQQGTDGQMYWTSTYSETLVNETSTTTDAQGRASITFAPDTGGSYRIAAESTDTHGNTVVSSAFSWAYGGTTFWGIEQTNSIDLIADKRSYEPGETAKILVPAPYSGMKALMTIERGSVIEHRLLTLSDTTEVLEVPINGDYAPNIYVSLVLIKPPVDELPVPDFRFGLVNLPISTSQQMLDIALTSDTTEASPRDEVTYSIRATDHSGQGVRAEVALALVDRAVLALRDDPNPTLAEAFYEKRPLGVFTSQSLVALVDRLALRLEPGAKGGGGGDGEGVLVRSEFPDTAYWNPAVVTNEQGEASITVALPDSLTTWRMTARALTDDTLVGQQTTDLVATLPLLVRPSLPRFLTVGDSPTLQAVLHNTTPEAIDATVRLEAEGLDIASPAEQTVRVPASGQSVVRWPADVPPGDQATLRFTLSGGSLRDAVEKVVPIQRFVTPEVAATAGQVHDEPVIETIAFDLPADAATGGDIGELKLELVPSLAAGVESGLTYLETYPYACTEQTVSRFLPNIATYHLARETGLDDANLQANLARTLSSSLHRLYTMQNLDGGWGWWSTDRSNPYLTAYVVQGLIAAGEAGYGVDQQVLDTALAYLEGVLSGESPTTGEPTEEGEEMSVPREEQVEAEAEHPEIGPNTRAYILFVLAEAGHPDRGRTIDLFDERERLALDSRAYLLMTLDRLGGEDQRAQTLIGELMSSAHLRTTTAHWEEDEPRYRTMSSTTRTTALALQALVRTDPDNFLIPNAVRYLMGERENGHWRTTLETAVSLLALTEYLAQSGELDANYTYRAVLNGETLREGDIHRGNLDERIAVALQLADLVEEKAANEQQRAALAFQKEGPGQLYYTMRMRYYQDAEEVEPLDRGMSVQRGYMAVDQATLEPTGQPVAEAAPGEVVQVQILLDVPEQMHYLVVEDMLPAGLEPLDTSLKTVTDAADDEEEFAMMSSQDLPDWWFFAQSEIYDNRVALFASDLPAGTYTYTYLARAATPGTFQVLPAIAYEMYEPEVFGRSNGARFVVTAP